MTRNEVLKLIEVIKAAYPAAYKNMDMGTAKIMVELWTEAFSGDDADRVLGALKKIIYTDTSDFPPNIAQIREKMFEQDSGMNAIQAWALVKKACNSWDHVQSFKQLPPEIQACCTPNTLAEWGMVDSQTFNTVIMSQFIKVYNSEIGKKHERQMLPEATRKALEGTVKKIGEQD
jgi:hypothetical protein